MSGRNNIHLHQEQTKFVTNQTVYNLYYDDRKKGKNGYRFKYKKKGNKAYQQIYSDVQSIFRESGMTVTFGEDEIDQNNNNSSPQQVIPYTTPYLNDQPIPSNTEYGAIELAHRVELKLKEMRMIGEYILDPKWLSIISNLYIAQYTAWISLIKLEQNTIKQQQNIQQLEAQSQHNNVEMERDKKSTHEFGDILIDDKSEELDHDCKFISSTRVYVARSVEGYPFGDCMSEQETTELHEKIKDILQGCTGDDLRSSKCYNYPSNNMDGDHFIGRCIFCNENETFLIGVNRDQLRIISMEQGANIRSVVARLQNAFAAMNAKLQWGISNDTIDVLFNAIGECDTRKIPHSIRKLCVQYSGLINKADNEGFTASVHIKIPLTSQKKNKSTFNGIVKRNNLQIDSIHDDHFGAKGGIYDVSNKNKRSAGVGIRDLINGCKELIQSEEKSQNEQREILKKQCRCLIQRGRGPLNKNKHELFQIVCRALNNGVEKQVTKKILQVSYHPNVVLINVQGTTLIDVGSYIKDVAITICSGISNYHETKRLAWEAIKTLPFEERGRGHQKRFIYHIEGKELQLLSDHRTVGAIKTKKIKNAIGDGIDDIKSVLKKIQSNLTYSVKLEMRDLFKLLDKLFTLFIRNCNGCNDYMAQYSNYEYYFMWISSSLIECENKKISLKAMVTQLFQCQIEAKTKIFWIHFISSCCHRLNQKYNNNDIAEWNIDLISYVLNLLLQCFVEYYSLFASPKTFIIDMILGYIIAFHGDKHNVLFKTHLNVIQSLFPAIKNQILRGRLAQLEAAHSSTQMSSIQQQAVHQRSQLQSMGTTSIYTGSASIPRMSGLTAQHILSQLSAPMLQVKPLTSDILQSVVLKSRQHKQPLRSHKSSIPAREN